jgi:hypothetical protein
VPQILSIHLILYVVSQDATFIAHRGKVPEAMERSIARFIGRKPLAFEALDEHVDVLRQFIIDLVVNRRSPEEPCAVASDCRIGRSRRFEDACHRLTIASTGRTARAIRRVLSVSAVDADPLSMSDSPQPDLIHPRFCMR